MNDSTLMSSKGQVVLPKRLRERRGWDAGMRLAVIETAEGVLLRPAKPVGGKTLDEVAGSLHRKGVRHSLAEMDAGIGTAVRKRHARR